MASRLLHRLACPSYDLCWLSLEPEAQGEKAAVAELVLVAGGGGTGNTGVKNQIQVAKYVGSGDFDFLPEYCLDRFCSGLCQGRLGGLVVVCALLEMQCLVLSVSQATTGEGVLFKRLFEFTADFSEKDASLNSVIVAQNDVLVTGGEDGVVRVWNVTTAADPTAFSVSKSRDCKGHKGPIMALAKHPSKPWVCSASKDGSCKIWSLDSTELLSDIPCIDAASGISSSASMKFQCRGCVFSKDGSNLYSIQCGARGVTHLIQFSLEIIPDEKKVKSVAVKTVIANKDPSTRLVLSDGNLLAVGCSNGFVSVFRADETLTKVIAKSCHDDYPVTGIAFSSSSAAKNENSDCFFVTCSADNRMASVVVRRSKLLLLAIFLLVVFLLWAISWQRKNK